VNGLSIRSSRHASSSNRPSRIARRWRPTRSPTSLTPTPPSAAAILRQPMQSPRLRQSPGGLAARPGRERVTNLAVRYHLRCQLQRLPRAESTRGLERRAQNTRPGLSRAA